MTKSIGLTALILFIPISFLFSCASTPSAFEIDRYGRAKELIVWPDPPDKPRYRYAGQLTGEDNFVNSTEKSTVKAVFQWITGAITGKKVPVMLQRPQMGAVDEDSGRIYVTDVSRAAVFVFDEVEGKLHIWEMAKPMVRFISPIGVAVGRDGEVFVADSELGVVVRLDRNGKPKGVIGEGKFKRPTGLARDNERGLLYVTDSHAHDIKVFNDMGELVNIIGKRGDKKGSLNFPTHISFADGKLYVSDTINARVQIFSADGDFIKTFGRRGLYVGNFTRPKGVAVDGEGHIYVVESYYDSLLIFDKDGLFLLQIGGTGAGIGDFYLPAGIWTDNHDRIFVADMFNRRVAVFQYLEEG